MTFTTRFALAVLMSVLFVPGAVHTSGGDQVAIGNGVSLEPAISIVGGPPSARAVVRQTTERFVSNDLTIARSCHQGPRRCHRLRGSSRPVPSGRHDRRHRSVLRLRVPRTPRTRPRLGGLNLDDTERQEFQQAVGATTWNSHDVPHDLRATEIAADAIAYGLLSTPARPGTVWDRRCERFEALTGFPPPRPTGPVETTAGVDPAEIDLG